MTVKTVMDLAYRLTGRMALPRELETLRGRCLLHVSDTPSTFYGDLQRLLLFLCPLALIHTGDVADDVKLELRPREIGLYSRKAADLLGRLGTFPEGLYITGGNHDDTETLRRLAPEATVFDGAAVVTVCGLTLAMAHYFRDLPGRLAPTTSTAIRRRLRRPAGKALSSSTASMPSTSSPPMTERSISCPIPPTSTATAAGNARSAFNSSGR